MYGSVKADEVADQEYQQRAGRLNADCQQTVMHDIKAVES